MTIKVCTNLIYLSSKSSIQVKGDVLDKHTRCSHYHSSNDIIAVSKKCCNEYYACIDCHNDTAGHIAEVWPISEFETNAIFCGNCFNEMTISSYLKSKNQCPFCKADFNPGCSNHYHFYFETALTDYQ